MEWRTLSVRGDPQRLDRRCPSVRQQQALASVHLLGHPTIGGDLVNRASGRLSDALWVANITHVSA